ncbi:hypothetical protein HMH01_01920 [Halovulum dunhuangense]|uniref:STAS domain-containing protein n=1 Tax=Halovulum dunhuangense TaxID=1505036 RepID=A0A849KZJ8_9RHOB|nr:hypothetical protein [Halovulum dunhuangense]NNU79184.1 hypothetical protein [Halovulum dunhuangense]
MSAGLRIDVPESAGLDAALALQSALAGAAGPVTLVAGGARSLSTPYVLTICAALRDANGPAIAVEGAGPGFMDAFSDLGLFGDLMKMEFPG